MNTLAKKTLAAVAALTLGTQAFAASGPTAVKINFPHVVILHYISDVTFNVPDTAFGDSSGNLEIVGGSAITLSTYSAGDISGDAGITVALTTELDAYTGTINNAWAVRALAVNDIEVSITVTGATAANGASSATITDASVSRGTTFTPTVQFAAPGMSQGLAVKGHVQLNMDFSAVTVPGDHIGAEYTVRAVEL